MGGPRGLSVLYVSETYTPHDRRFLAALAERVGHLGWLALGPPERGSERRPVPKGVETFRPETEDGPDPETDLETMTRVVWRAARSFGADLVHGGPVGSVGLAAVRARAAPTVVMSWGSDVLLGATAPAEVRERLSMALADASGFVADAACVETAAIELGLSAATPRAVFPWGVEADRLQPPAAPGILRHAAGGPDVHVCVATRAWTRAYRIDLLAEAFAQASREDARLRLFLLGDGEEAPRVQARLRTLIDSGAVWCPGWEPADLTRRYLEASDLYVSTVPSDGSSISLLEAMAAARPAIVADAFGNREWVEPGVTGWLTPVGNASAMAAAILEAFTDVERLRRMGAAAREVVLTRARWEDGVERLLALYETVTA